VRGGTLNLALKDDVPSLDPALGYDTYSTAFVHAIATGLLDYDASGKLVPDLAERWEISPDRTQYTFHLRPGLKFSDGSPLQAADFKYSLERALRLPRSPGADFFTIFRGARAYRDGNASSVSGIEAADPTTLRIILELPNATCLNVLALSLAAPVSRAAVQWWGADFASHPVGAGPFRVKARVPGQRLQLERNPFFYRRDRPYLDGVDLQIGVEERVQVLRFENGQLDILHFIPFADYPRFKADPRWSALLVERPVNTVWFLGMNTRMKPFNNLKVRQAVAYAVDQSRVIRLQNGRGRPLAGVLPPTMPGCDPAIKGFPHDPARARALLAQGGYPGGFSTTLWVASGERYEKIAEGVQADLKAVGIDAQIKPAAFQTYKKAIHTANTTPIFYGGWYPDFPDPDNFVDPLFDSSHIHPDYSTNSSFLSDPEVDRLLHEGVTMPAGEARLKVYQRAQEAIMADAPWAPLYQEVESRLRQPWIGGLTIDPVWPYLRLAEIWKRAGT
jgi:peptide/nickel transport system substrate-binding protein/oligopeptide transport system substrate-binding protein